MPYTTKPGYTNRNGQVNLGNTYRPGTDHGQYVYVLHCPACNKNYGANGSDIFQRKCPFHQGGRPGLPLTSNEVEPGQLIAWLRADETENHKNRALRLGFLLDAVRISENGIFFHRETSLRMFKEACLAYVDGLYLATVLLSLAWVEHEIAGRLYAAGWGDAKDASLKRLLSEAFARNLISGQELKTLNDLRRVRNSHTHFQSSNKDSPNRDLSMLHRAVNQNMTPDEIFMEDARQAIKVLGGFLAERSEFF